jgi:hypothetical protein
MYAVLIALILLGFFFVSLRFYGALKNILSLLLLLGISAPFIISNQYLFRHHPKISSTWNKKDMEQRLHMSEEILQIDLKLPETLYCGSSETSLNWERMLVGWNISKNCLVNSCITTVFFPTNRCFTINYSIVRGDSSLLNIRVRRGLQFLQQENAPVVANNPSGTNELTRSSFQPIPYSPANAAINIKNIPSITQRYCSKNFIPNTTTLYSIGWVNGKDVRNFNSGGLLIKLNWISVDSRH